MDEITSARVIKTLVASLHEMTETYWGVDHDGNGDDRGEPPMVIVRAREALAYAKSKSPEAA